MIKGNGRQTETAPTVATAPYLLPAYEPPAEADAGDSFAMILQRRRVSAVLTMMVVTAATVPVIWMTVVPKYEVAGTVHIASFVRPILVSDHETDISRQYGEYSATEARFLTSPAVISAALETPEASALPWLATFDDPVAGIKDLVNVDTVPNTQLLRITMTGTDPQPMAVVINAMLVKYLEDRRRRRRAWDEEILSSLRAERSELERKLDAKNADLQEFAMSGGIGTNEILRSGAMGWTSALREAAIQSQNERAVAAAKLERLARDEDAGPREATGAAELRAYLASDLELQELRARRRAVEFEGLTGAIAGRGPDHPDVNRHSELMRMIGEKIEERETELKAEFVSFSRRKLTDEVATADILEQRLQGDLAQAEAEERRLSLKAFSETLRLEDLRHDRERLERLLSQVKQKTWNVEVEQNRAARVTIDALARAPRTPNIDKRPKYTVAVLFMAMVIAAGVALVRDRLDTRFCHPAHVPKRLGVPLLGTLQKARHGPSKHSELERTIADPVRGICVGMLAGTHEHGSAARLITSPTKGNGKSSLAICLARRLALTGRRVLLVDGDNRGRAVSRRLELHNRPGLSELLAGTHALEETTHTCDIAQLKVIPVGRSNGDFSELLCGRRGQAALRRAFESFEEVIVDSPPVLVGSDAIVLATLVEEIVLVLHAEKSTLEEAQAAKERLQRVSARVSGVVLNGVDPRNKLFSSSYAYELPPETTEG